MKLYGIQNVMIFLYNFQIQVMKDDQDNFKDTAFNTSVRGRVPPLITTKCVIRDDGNNM